jgi:hypothetical protein
MPITSKPYFCPLCGNVESHSTNHTNEIYTHCRACNSDVLYCQNAPAQTPDRRAILHYYDFSLDGKGDRSNDSSLAACFRRNYPLEETTWKALKANLESIGYKHFHVTTEYRTMQALKAHDGEVINLYDSAQFNGQYVSSIGRVHDWFEASFPNRLIHCGYYLEFLD